MEKPNFDESMTESQVIRLRDVPESVRSGRAGTEQKAETENRRETERKSGVSFVGKSLYLKGDLKVDEDLVIEGKVEGTVSQGKGNLTVNPSGRVNANVNATKIFVEGKVKGDLHATASVKVCQGGEVEGNIVAPSVSIEEGATFNGSIEMRSPSGG